MLQLILAPAMTIMSRLRFAVKLGLIGALFLAPLAGMTYFLDGQIKRDINFAVVERLGVRQLIPARQLLQIMQWHRRTSQLMIAGDENARLRLPAVTEKADAAFGRLRDASGSGDAPVKLAEEFARLSSLWEEIRAALYADTAEAGLSKHNKLISGITSFVQLTADKSNLSLDPEIDSYYMVNILSAHLPNTLNYLGQTRGLGYFALKRRAMTVDERVALNVLQKQFAREFGSLESALDSAMGANDALRNAMQATRQEAEKAAGFFLGADSLAMLNGELTLDPAEFFERGSAAIAALYRLFDVSARELDGLLAARIERSEANLHTILFGAGLVLLLVLYFFAGMLFSVLRSLQAIKAGAERLARGDLSRPVDSHSTDELREVGGAVNSVTQTLKKFTDAQIQMSRAHNDKGRIEEEMPADVFPGVYGDMARNLNAMVESHIEVQKQFVRMMVDYANGRFEDRMAPLPGERKAISDAAHRLRGVLRNAQQAAKETLRIKFALDNTSSAVMLADNEGVIRYRNKALTALMQRLESGLGEALPGFTAAGILGRSVDSFHSCPGHQQTLLANLKCEHRREIQIGDLRLRLIVNPIVDESGARLGTVVECLDRDAEANAEKEMGVTEAAAAGSFSKPVLAAAGVPDGSPKPSSRKGEALSGIVTN
jgi:methyl-accepting chemotaxis protein